MGEKIAIDGGDRAGEYYMVCLLHVDATNRMYLHEVRTIKTDNTRSKTGASVGETNLQIPSASYPSSLSLRNKMMDVNTKFQLKKTVEESENLITVHNLDADKLTQMLKYVRRKK